MSLQTGALARPTLDPQPRTARPARAQVFNLPVTASTVLHQPAEATAWRWLKALLVGLWSCASLALVFLLWELLPRLGVVDPVWFPPLSKVLATWNQMWQSGELLDHIQGSLVRSLSGFSLAVLSAVPIGFLIGWFPPVRRFLNSALEFFRNTSALALLPVFILFLGIGEASKIGIVVFACFFPILLNTISGVAMTDPVLIKSARSLGFGPLGIFIRIVLPSAVPSIFTGFRLAAENAVLVLIAAEMVGATRGLGFLINYAQFNFLIPKMYAGILTIAVLGLALNYLLVRGERHLSRWRVQPAQP